MFGRPERVLTSAAERQMDPTLPQALHAINGDTLNKKLMDADGRIAALARARAIGRRRRRRDLPLGVRAGRPSAEERQALAARIDAAPDRRQIVEDLAWAVLTSREFLFTH